MYDCPNCGGPLHFDIPSQKVICDHCGGVFDPYAVTKERDAVESDFFGVTVFTCPQCGGEIMTTDESSTGFCSYCGASTILDSRMSEEKRPDIILPFKITGEECRRSYKKMIRKAVFAPGGLKNAEYMNRFRGIYIPYWVYDVGTGDKITFEGTRTRSSGSYTYTDHYDLICDVDSAFDGIAYDASSSFDDHIGEEIAPYEAKDFQPFTPSFLCGFYADIADVDSRVYEAEARNLAGNEIYRQVSPVPEFKGYTVKVPKDQREMDAAYGLHEKSVKYALLPVWFATWRDKDRVLYTVVNGQTGKITADLPVSIPRFLLGSLLLAVPLFLLATLLFTFTAPGALMLSSALSLVALILYGKEIAGIIRRENREGDKGYQLRTGVTKQGKAEAPTDKAIRDNTKYHAPAKKQKTKRSFGSILGGCLSHLVAALIFYWFVIVLAISAVRFIIGILQKATLDPRTAAVFNIIILIACVIAIMIIRKTAKKLPHLPVMRDTIWAVLSVACASVLGLLRRPEDFINYAGVAFCLLGAALTLIGLIRKYNKLSTRPLPGYYDRKGGVTGKALLSILLMAGVGMTLFASSRARAEESYQYENRDTGYEIYIDDGADLLSDREEDLLLENMLPITQYGGAAFVSSDWAHSGTAASFAEENYRAYFGTDSGTLFLIDMDEREIYIFSDGTLFRTIDRSKAYVITDNVYRYATRGEYYECARNAFSQINTLLEGGRIAQPMKHISNALLSFNLALLLNYLLVRLTGRTKKASEKAVLGAASAHFAMANAHAVLVKTTKTRNTSSSGGGGFIGGGGGGGGGFGGGGGGGFGGGSGGGGGHGF